MRFDRIEVIRFGALEGVTLDLSRGAQGLHVIYGDNEAGKTTLRRAISALLFGIPERTADNFRFDNKELRLGATLRFAEGPAVTFLRKKARKADLLDSSEQPLRLPQLEALARDLGQDRFQDEWSLDHQRLRAGGQELIEGKGRVGESLLSAGLGGLPISRILEQLGVDAGELFRPGGSAPRVNELLRRIADLRAELTASCVSPKEIEEKERRLTELREERARHQRQRDEAQRLLSFLERVERARPMLGRRQMIRADLALLESVPSVGADFGARRIEATRASDHASSELEKANAQLGELDQRLASLSPDEAVLAAGSDIEGLAARVEVYAADVEELSRLDQSSSDAELAIAAEARGIGLERDALVALARGPYQQHAANVRSVADGLAESEPEVTRFEQELADCQRRVEVLRAREGALPPVEDVSALRTAFDQLTADGPPDRALARLRQKVEAAEADAARAFEGLSRWTQPRAAFEKATLPTADEVDAHTDALAVKASVEAAGETVAEARAEVEKCRRERQRLEAKGEVPTPEALEKARKRRDAGWKLVRQQLEGGAPSASAVQRFAGGEELPDAYETAVVTADQLADGLRDDAQRVGRFVQICERIEEAESALEKAESALAQHQRALQQAESAWRSLWERLRVEPASPRAMRTWLASAEEVRRQIRVATTARKECAHFEAELEQRAAPVAAALGRKLGALDKLAALRAEAESKLQAAERARAERAEVKRQLEEATSALATRRRELERAVQKRDACRKARREVSLALGVAEDTTVAVLRAVIAAVTQVAARLQQLDRDVQKRGELQRRKTEFEQAALTLRKRLQLGEERRADVVARELSERLKTARAADQARRQALALKERAQESRQDAQARLAEAQKSLARLCEEAGTRDVSALAQVQEQNERRRELQRSLAQCEEALVVQAANGRIDDLAAEVASVPADEVATRRAAAAETVRETGALLEKLTGDLAVLDKELADVRGTDTAAEKSAELQSALAQLREHAASYLRLKYAESMLKQAVDRFREENQNPVLKRTSELFSRLTLGSFLGIEVDDQEEEAMLRGHRLLADGRRESLSTEAMSDGARDQLYLALRIATLEHELSAREPLPLVVDDILIQLSDNRARAALKVLIELSKKTQVLLFTHHRRVVELAQAIKAPEVFVHELAAQPASEVPGWLSAAG